MNRYNGNILIIDDDQDVLDSAKIFLEEYFEQVSILNTPQELNQHLSEKNIDLILLDMNFRKGAIDGKEGLYWLKYIQM